MQTRLVILVAIMIMLTGCGVAVFREIDLTYTPNNKIFTQNFNKTATVYLQKPNMDDLLNLNSNIKESDANKFGRWRTLDKIIRTNEAIRYFKSKDIEVLFMKDSVLFHQMDKERIISDDFVNVGSTISVNSMAKNPDEWVLSALGTELKALGYHVEYVKTLPDNANNGIIININNLFSNIASVEGAWYIERYCRGNIDIDFSIIAQGQTVKKFNVNNVADFPKYADITSPELYNCNPVALSGTLAQVMQQAVPTIAQILQVAVSSRDNSFSEEQAVKTKEAIQEDESKVLKPPAKAKKKTSKAKAATN